MVEINRKLYMDEKTGEKLSSFEKMKDIITAFIQTLVADEEILNKKIPAQKKDL